MTQPTFRALRGEDAPGCGELLGRLPEWFGLPEANADYVEALRSIPGFVAEMDGEVVGFLGIERHAPASAEILVMGVAPGFHRSGIGRELVRLTEGWCVDRSVRWLHVKTRGPSTFDEGYERTRAFYEAVGFEWLYESMTEWGPEDAALVMIKAVSA